LSGGIWHTVTFEGLPAWATTVLRARSRGRPNPQTVISREKEYRMSSLSFRAGLHLGCPEKTSVTILHDGTIRPWSEFANTSALTRWEPSRWVSGEKEERWLQWYARGRAAPHGARRARLVKPRRREKLGSMTTHETRQQYHWRCCAPATIPRFRLPKTLTSAAIRSGAPCRRSQPNDLGDALRTPSSGRNVN